MDDELSRVERNTFRMFVVSLLCLATLAMIWVTCNECRDELKKLNTAVEEMKRGPQ